MSVYAAIYRKTLETLGIYWELVRIILPVTIVTQLLLEFGVIQAVSPYFAPVMAFVGLPPELAFTWLTGLLVGLWGAIVTIFTLTPVETLSNADVTILSVLLLIAHGLPIEQRIIQKTGPGLLVTSALRIGGGLLFAAILHRICAATGWLGEPVQPAWVPMQESSDWIGFLQDTVKALLAMLVILVGLSWLIEIFKMSGIMGWLNRLLAPLFRLAGIQAPAVPFAAIGLFLGISYGGGLLIREAREANVEPRQVFLTGIFLGFAHSIIEDTLIVVALGADITTVVVGRLVFSLAATALVAWAIGLVSDRLFFTALFRKAGGKPTRPEPDMGR